MGQLFADTTITKGRDTNSPNFDGYAVTPSDSTDLPNGPTKALFVTVGGNVNVQLDSDSTALLTLTAGEIYPIMVSRVKSTSTTATGIFALYK